MLLVKNRRIREGLVDLKKLAKKVGVTSMDTRWFECQAELLVAMRIDHELERDVAEEKAQPQDTAEAISTAGKLLLRLKEAEEAVCMALVRSFSLEKMWIPQKHYLEFRIVFYIGNLFGRGQGQFISLDLCKKSWKIVHTYHSLQQSLNYVFYSSKTALLNSSRY